MKNQTTEVPKNIVIEKVTRSRRFISISYKLGDENHLLESKDNPLPAFGKALDALVPLVCEIIEVPMNWEEGLTVSGLTMGEMRDVATASIHAKRDLHKSAKLFKITTPPALMSTPKTEGGITDPLSASQAGLIDEVIEQAKAYIKGERAQGQLALDDDEDDEGFGEEDSAEATAPLPLPLPTGSAGKPAKKRAKKK